MYTTLPQEPHHRMHADEIRESSEKYKKIAREIHKVIIGQEEAVTALMIAFLARGHILLEGVPGVAKTTMIKAFTQALGLTFKRIQFTPDLLPSDLIGTLVFNPKTHEFETKRGPIFAHLILADEINRAPAKVQSALLEAMQERQVTIGSTTFELPHPFVVCATQNPLEQEGTYRLPEAQVDRFMFKVVIRYPSAVQEKQIVTGSLGHQVVDPVLAHEELAEIQQTVEKVYVDERIIDYIVALIQETRVGMYARYFSYGASPRATVALFQAARAHAFLKGRYFVVPDDVKAIAGLVLQHRLFLTYDAEKEGLSVEEIIQRMVKAVPSL